MSEVEVIGVYRFRTQVLVEVKVDEPRMSSIRAVHAGRSDPARKLAVLASAT